MFEYFRDEKMPRNGSAFRWNGSAKALANRAIKQRAMSPINVRVFKGRQEAADWLGLPIERLEMRKDLL